MGGSLSRLLVLSGPAQPTGADAESGPHATRPSGATTELVSGERRDIQWCRRGPQQQTSCGDQTFLRFSHLRCHGNRSLSHVGPPSRTGLDPQFLLSKLFSKLDLTPTLRNCARDERVHLSGGAEVGR